MDKAEIWREALRDIEDKINNKQSFETWLKPTVIDSINDEEINLLVPNKFFGEWIKDHFIEVIDNALKQIIKKDDLKINFVVSKRDHTDKEESPERKEQKWADEKKIEIKKKAGLNIKYTFSNFVPGPCNEFAYAAARAVAESPAKAYNPLFIYGGVGLGKTHLITAIGHYILDPQPTSKVMYVSTEKFTNEMINSIRYERMQEFRNRYRNVDVLLVDDIQFITGKEATQEEFFHTFNALYETEKQIIISSDRFPKDIPDMEDRLTSRFNWGLIADIQPPDLETRIAILRKKAENERINLPDGVALYLANLVRSNVRDLEGALIRVGAFASFTNSEITVELAKEVLKNTISDRERVVTIEDIQKEVANSFHIKVAELKSKKRTKSLVLPRQISMYLCRELINLSFPEIGRSFGGKDHTTVIHACRQVERMKEEDSIIREKIESIMRILKD